MELTTMFFLVGAIIILLWCLFAHKRRDIPNAKQSELASMTQTLNTADKSAKRKAKRDRRKRKKNRISTSNGSQGQDLTLDIDCPINTGQTADVGVKPRLHPFDACEVNHSTSCSSKSAKKPLVSLCNEEKNATDLPSSPGDTGDFGEKSSSLSSEGCKKGGDIPNVTKSDPILVPNENDGRIATLRYIARSEIPRIAGKGGRITKLLEKKHGVKIDLPQGDNGNIIISGGNETTRLAVEACIRDRLIMTVTLPNVDTHTRVAIKKLVALRKLKLLNESDQGSMTFTGLTRDCKVVLSVPKCN